MTTRNTVKVGVSHYPGICTAAVILLKDRDHEMWSTVPALSSFHAEEQVMFVDEKNI